MTLFSLFSLDISAASSFSSTLHSAPFLLLLNSPTMSGTNKAPLGDITHRTLTGRRSGNTAAQQVANLTCSAGQGDENNPTRGLLDLFAAQSGSVSLNRKRSLKRFTDDSEHPIARFLSPQHSPTKPSATKSNAAKAGGVLPTKSPASTVVVVDPIPMLPTGPLFLHSAKTARPTSILSTISRRQTFGLQRNMPYYGKALAFSVHIRTEQVI